MFENWILRRIFGPKTDEVTGEWKKLHKEELYNLYSSPNIIRQIRLRRMMVWHAREGTQNCTRLSLESRRKETTWKKKA
jgi:hypothetical protein